jgi:hypothetical protein
MIKTIIIGASVTFLSINSADYLVTLDSKHYKEYVKVKDYEEAPKGATTVVGSLEDSIVSVTDADPNGIKIANLTDGIWDCSISGTHSGSNNIAIGLESPQKINYIISSGMMRLWNGPLNFHAVVDGTEVLLGSILTSGYCAEGSQTKITFDEVETSKIVIRTGQYMYIGELDFGYEN